MFDHPVPWLLGVLGGFATGAARRFGPDRLGRITLFGNLFGGALLLLILLLIVLIEVLF